MKRTRRKILEEDFDSTEKKIEKEDKKKSKKSKPNKDNVEINKVNQDEKEIQSDYNKFVEEIVKNLNDNQNSYSIKPKYISKPYDKSNLTLKKLEKLVKFKLVSPFEIYYKTKFEEYHKISMEEDKCSICQYHFYDDLRVKRIEECLKIDKEKKNILDVILLEKCTGHFFHLDCLDILIGDKSYLKCPNCNQIYGVMTGDQPDGTMKAYVANFKCGGFLNCGTIVIDYSFPTGKNYTGTHRTAYLPNNQEGKEVLALLKVAFDRKLLFTVGTSVTTGEENTTVWNGVHHKTSLKGGSHNYGYPDPTYFNRVKQELASKGILEDNIEQNLEDVLKSLIEEDSKLKKKKR